MSEQIKPMIQYAVKILESHAAVIIGLLSLLSVQTAPRVFRAKNGAAAFAAAPFYPLRFLPLCFFLVLNGDCLAKNHIS